MDARKRSAVPELQRVVEFLRNLPGEVPTNHHFDLKDQFFTKAGRLLNAAILCGAFGDDGPLLDILEQQKEGEFGPFFWSAVKKWLVPYRRYLFTGSILGPTLSAFRQSCNIIANLIDEESKMLQDQEKVAAGSNQKLLTVGIMDIETGHLPSQNTGESTHKTKQQTNKRRMGRPTDTDLKEDEKLFNDWQAARNSGSSRRDFAQVRGIKERDLKLALDRHRHRRKKVDS